MCALFVKMEINYRHVLPIIVFERTVLYFVLYYCITQGVPKRMHRFISVTKTISFLRLHRKESHGVRSGDLGHQELRRWSWLPL